VYPQDLSALKDSQDLHASLDEEKPRIEAKLSPLEEKFKLLDEYSIGLKEDDVLRRNSVKEKWLEFAQMLDRIQTRNQKVSADLYNECMSNLGQFKKETEEHRLVFLGNAPFESLGLTNERAFATLAEYKDNTRALRRREDNMKFGFDLFKIDYQASPDLDFVDLSIKTLETVW